MNDPAVGIEAAQGAHSSRSSRQSLLAAILLSSGACLGFGSIFSTVDALLVATVVGGLSAILVLACFRVAGLRGVSQPGRAVAFVGAASSLVLLSGVCAGIGVLMVGADSPGELLREVTSLFRVVPDANVAWSAALLPAAVASIVSWTFGLEVLAGRGRGVWTAFMSAGVFIAASTLGTTRLGPSAGLSAVWLLAVMSALALLRGPRVNSAPATAIAAGTFAILVALALQVSVPSTFGDRDRTMSRPDTASGYDGREAHPLTDLTRQLSAVTPTPLFEVARADDAGQLWLPVAVLDRFNEPGERVAPEEASRDSGGELWSEGGSYAELGRRIRSERAAAGATTDEVEIQLLSYSELRLPTLRDAIRIIADSKNEAAPTPSTEASSAELEYNSTTGGLRRPSQLSDTAYSIVALRPERRVDASSAIVLPRAKESRPAFCGTAEWSPLVEGLTNLGPEYETRARGIEELVADDKPLGGTELPDFSISNPPSGHTLRQLTAVVGGDTDTSGVEQRVAIAAALARCADMQSRIIVGFRSETSTAPDPARSDREIATYTSANMTAWFEVLIPGVGWRSFTARPPTAAEPPIPPPPPTSGKGVGSVVPPQATTTLPEERHDPCIGPVRPPECEQPERPANLWWVLVAIACLLTTTPAAVRAYYSRRRRRYQPPVSAIIGYWVDMISKLDRWFGLPGLGHLTPGQVVEYLSGTPAELSGPADEELGRPVLISVSARALIAGTSVPSSRVDLGPASLPPYEQDVPGREVSEYGESLWSTGGDVRVNLPLARAAARTSYARAAEGADWMSATSEADQKADVKLVLDEAAERAGGWRRFKGWFKFRRDDWQLPFEGLAEQADGGV